MKNLNCDSCNFCDSCNSCNFCRNLKMTEYNIFCFARAYNDSASFQQDRYRVFNKNVSKERYFKLEKEINKILPTESIHISFGDFYKSITNVQWNQLLEIPEAYDFREGFEYISGCKIENVQEMTLSEICKELGRTIKIVE